MTYKQFIVAAVSPSGMSGQDMAIDAKSARDALDEFHDLTDDKLVEWTITVIEVADPTAEETRA